MQHTGGHGLCSDMALLFTGGKKLFALYLTHAGMANAFGAAGSLAALLMWLYFSAAVLLLGAEFSAARPATAQSALPGGTERERQTGAAALSRLPRATPWARSDAPRQWRCATFCVFRAPQTGFIETGSGAGLCISYMLTPAPRPHTHKSSLKA